jgi:hypothetical protein
MRLGVVCGVSYISKVCIDLAGFMSDSLAVNPEDLSFNLYPRGDLISVEY